MNKLLVVAANVGLVTAAGADDRTPARDTKEPAKSEKRPVSLKGGDPAPPLKVGKWLQGGEVKKFEPGKVYVVEFWATWCGPCIAFMPHLAGLQAEYKDKGVTVIGFTSKEKSGNTREKVTAFVESRGPKLEYTFAWADDEETDAEPGPPVHHRQDVTPAERPPLVRDRAPPAGCRRSESTPTTAGSGQRAGVTRTRGCHVRQVGRPGLAPAPAGVIDAPPPLRLLIHDPVDGI